MLTTPSIQVDAQDAIALEDFLKDRADSAFVDAVTVEPDLATGILTIKVVCNEVGTLVIRKTECTDFILEADLMLKEATSFFEQKLLGAFFHDTEHLCNQYDKLFIEQ